MSLGVILSLCSLSGTIVFGFPLGATYLALGSWSSTQCVRSTFEIIYKVGLVNIWDGLDFSPSFIQSKKSSIPLLALETRWHLPLFLPGCHVVRNALRTYQQAMALPPLSLLGEPDEGGSDQYPKDTWTTSILPGVCAPQEKKKNKQWWWIFWSRALLSAHIPWPSKKVSALILHGRGIESEVFPVAFNTTIMKRVCQPRCWMSFKGRFPENNQQKWSK